MLTPLLQLQKRVGGRFAFAHKGVAADWRRPHTCVPSSDATRAADDWARWDGMPLDACVKTHTTKLEKEQARRRREGPTMTACNENCDPEWCLHTM